MQEKFTAKPARAASPLERIAERAEAEIAHLRKKRPALSERIDRAGNILVMHMSCPHSRVVRVRVGADRRARFLVSSANCRGAVYSVTPGEWTCSCPDHQQRSRGGKHAIACYVLWRAALPAHGLAQHPCAGCGLRLHRRDLVELNEDNHDNLTYCHGDMLCRECADEAEVTW